MSEKVATSPPIYRFGNYVLDTKQKSLFYSEQIIPLSQKSFECLLLLVENAEKVVLKEDFFQKIWTDSFVEDGVLAVNISNLRKSLETNQNQRYIETIPRRGYRFLAKVTVEFNDSDQNLLDNSQITDEFNNDFSEKNNEFEVDEIENRPNIDEIINKEIPIVRFKFSKIHFLALSILIILLGLTAFFIYQKYIQKKTDAVTKVSVAVFPFENISGNQDLNYLSLSMSDSLGYSLASLTHVGVVPTSIIKKYVGQNYDPIVEAGNLKVENIVTGSYRTQGNKVFFEVQLKDVTKTNNLVQSQIFEANLDNLTTLRTTIFKFLIQGLNLNKTDFELSEIQKQETQNPLAYEYYLKGSTAYFNSQLDSSINYYQKALELDPNFLLALEGIATDYLQKGSVAGCGAPCYQKSIEYREQIVRIAPEYERGQLNLALLYVDSNQIDKAVPIIKTILAKNKESKHGLFVLAYAYRYAGLIDESIRLTEKSQALELMDSTPSTPTTSYIYASQYEKFLQTFHSPPNNPYGLFYKGFANYYLKNYSEAKISFESAYNISSDLLTSKLAKVYLFHLDSNDESAFKMLNEMKDSLIKNQVNDGEMIYKLAQAYSELKRPKEALEMFNLSIDKGFFCYPYFKTDPLLDNIRKDKDFDNILQKAQKRHNEFKNKFLNDNQSLSSMKKVENSI